MTLTDCMCQEKKEDENLPTFKRAIDTVTRKPHKKAQRKTDYNHQKQYKHKQSKITIKQNWDEKQQYRHFK